MDRLLLTVAEAATAAGISRTVAYELVHNGAWPSVRLGREIRVPAEGLRQWVDNLIEQNDMEGRTRVTSR